MTVFIATLGQRPEAISMALDKLMPRYRYEEIVILHTDLAQSAIADAFPRLIDVLEGEYPAVTIRGCDFRFGDGRPLLDITDQWSAEAYYYAMLNVLREYRIEHVPVHLLIAGGRKAMSIYAALAAVLLFGEHDCVWTVLAPGNLMRPGLFHAPPGQQDSVKIVQLPVLPSRLLPGVMADHELGELLQRANTTPRQQFLNSLTVEEHSLAELYTHHPYASNEVLGELLQKSPRTIENQFRSIYGKLFSIFNLDISDRRKRQVLLDVLNGRV